MYSDHKHSCLFPGRARNNPQVLTVVPSLKVFRLTEICQHYCCGTACWNLVYLLPLSVTMVRRHEHLSHPSCSDMTPRHHVTQIFISLLLPTFRAHNVLSWTVGWDESILTCQVRSKFCECRDQLADILIQCAFTTILWNSMLKLSNLHIPPVSPCLLRGNFFLRCLHVDVVRWQIV